VRPDVPCIMVHVDQRIYKVVIEDLEKLKAVHFKDELPKDNVEIVWVNGDTAVIEYNCIKRLSYSAAKRAHFVEYHDDFDIIAEVTKECYESLRQEALRR